MKNFFIIIILVTMLAGCSKTKDITYCEEGNCTVCYYPKNPYRDGTGHFAGYEWAKKNEATSCGGNSPSFIGGCEVYVQQVIEYYTCP